MVALGDKVAVLRVKPVEGVDAAALGVEGAWFIDISLFNFGQSTEECGGKVFNDFLRFKWWNRGDDGRDAQRDAAFDIAHDALGEVELVLAVGDEGDFGASRWWIGAAVEQGAEGGIGNGEFGHVDVEHASVDAVDGLIHLDAILHKGVIALCNNRAVFISIYRQHVAGGDEDGELGLNVIKTINHVVDLSGVKVDFFAAFVGAVGDGGVKQNHHLKLLAVADGVVFFGDEVVKESTLGPVFAKGGVSPDECSFCAHEI